MEDNDDPATTTASNFSVLAIHVTLAVQMASRENPIVFTAERVASSHHNSSKGTLAVTGSLLSQHVSRETRRWTCDDRQWTVLPQQGIRTNIDHSLGLPMRTRFVNLRSP